MTVQYNQMESEVKSLQSQLEHEKSRFKKMQADLQKELVGAFNENTKLTALLDGKVPKSGCFLKKKFIILLPKLDVMEERIYIKCLL